MNKMGFKKNLAKLCPAVEILAGCSFCSKANTCNNSMYQQLSTLSWYILISIKDLRLEQVLPVKAGKLVSSLRMMVNVKKT